MALKPMYKGKVNSPETFIVGSISATDTEITINDISIVPEPPTLLVIGGNRADAETIRVTAINGNTLTAERGFQGEPRSHSANSQNIGETIARNFTAYDLDALTENIEMIHSEPIISTRLAENIALRGNPTAPTNLLRTDTSASIATTGWVNETLNEINAFTMLGLSSTVHDIYDIIQALNNHTETVPDHVRRNTRRMKFRFTLGTGANNTVPIARQLPVRTQNNGVLWIERMRAGTNWTYFLTFFNSFATQAISDVWEAHILTGATREQINNLVWVQKYRPIIPNTVEGRHLINNNLITAQWFQNALNSVHIETSLGMSVGVNTLFSIIQRLNSPQNTDTNPMRNTLNNRWTYHIINATRGNNMSLPTIFDNGRIRPAAGARLIIERTRYGANEGFKVTYLYTPTNTRTTRPIMYFKTFRANASEEEIMSTENWYEMLIDTSEIPKMNDIVGMVDSKIVGLESRLEAVETNIIKQTSGTWNPTLSQIAGGISLVRFERSYWVLTGKMVYLTTTMTLDSSSGANTGRVILDNIPFPLANHKNQGTGTVTTGHVALGAFIRGSTIISVSSIFIDEGDNNEVTFSIQYMIN